MSSTDRAAELRALADQLDEIGELEQAAEDATEAYRDEPAPDTYRAYRAAQEALRAARMASRESGLIVASGEAGSTAIKPATITGKA